MESKNGQFTRLYVAYVACIEGFCIGYRSLIFLDRTFLKDHYKGTFLAATAYDGDKELFSLVFCVRDIENVKNWDSFIRGLRMLMKCPTLMLYHTN